MPSNFFAQVFTSLIFTVLSALLAPRPPDRRPSNLEDFDLPTAEEGRDKPQIYGTVRITGSNVVWYGDLRYEAIKRRTGLFSKTTVGYRYFMGIQFMPCLAATALRRVLVAKREIWSGNVTTNSAVSVNHPELFGGEEMEGGIEGTFDVLFGAQDQPKNTYLVSALGSNDIPAFRDRVSIVLNQMYLTALTPYIKPWAFVFENIPVSPLSSATANINGALNAAHIIYDTLTNPDMGVEVPSSSINFMSFQAAADLFFSENMGLSFLVNQGSRAQSFIQDVLAHCNSILYTDVEDGRINIRPIREVTTPVTTRLDQTNVVRVLTYQRPAYPQLINEVVVNYREQGADKDSSVSIQNIAGQQAAGVTISQTNYYRGIDSSALALRVAERDLRQLSTQLLQINVEVNRGAWLLREGDVFIFNWPDYQQGDVQMRVTDINYGTAHNGPITLSAQEDIFTIPDMAFSSQQDNMWADPVVDTVDSPNVRVLEASYWEISQEYSAANFSALPENPAVIQILAQIPNILTPAFKIYTRVSGGEFVNNENGDYTPVQLLNAVVPIGNARATITLDGLPRDLSNDNIGEFVLIDNEAMIIISINTANNSIEVDRGTLDTTPSSHTSGSMVQFVSLASAFETEIYSGGQSVTGRAAVITGMDGQTVQEAAGATITTIGRFQRPYPPANFKINTEDFPTSFTGDLVVSWAHRNRITQTGPLIPTTQGSTGPETGVSYNVTIINAVTNTTIVTANVTGSSYTLTTAQEMALTVNLASSYRVEVNSVRASIESWQTQVHTLMRMT